MQALFQCGSMLCFRGVKSRNPRQSTRRSSHWRARTSLRFRIHCAAVETNIRLISVDSLVYGAKIVRSSLFPLESCEDAAIRTWKCSKKNWDRIDGSWSSHSFRCIYHRGNQQRESCLWSRDITQSFFLPRRAPYRCFYPDVEVLEEGLGSNRRPSLHS